MSTVLVGTLLVLKFVVKGKQPLKASETKFFKKKYKEEKKKTSQLISKARTQEQDWSVLGWR